MPFSLDATTVIILILALAILVLAWMVFKLHGKLQKFLLGSTTENLPESLALLNSSVKGLEHFKSEVETYLAAVEGRLRRSTQAIHTVRFNPFKGTTGSGGSQSFATAFLDEQKNGVIISSLYAREHVSIFAKPVVKGVSEYELSHEEREALEGALRMVK